MQWYHFKVMDSNLRKWCWNRTENILSMFYEHEEIHKFWAKEVITKRKNILAVNLTPSIAEGLIRQVQQPCRQVPAFIRKEFNTTLWSKDAGADLKPAEVSTMSVKALPTRATCSVVDVKPLPVCWHKERPFPKRCTAHLKQRLCHRLEEGLSQHVFSRNERVEKPLLAHNTREKHF